MLKAFKYRIYPNKEQEILLSKTFGCSRFVYNKILGDYLNDLKENEKAKFHTPAWYKDEFVWLSEVDSLALCNSQLHVQQAFKKFFKEIFPKLKKEKDINKKYKKRAIKQWKKDNSYEFTMQDIKGYPNFHIKKSNRNSYTTNNINDSIRIEKCGIKLPKIGFIQTIFSQWCSGKIKSATISKTSSGKYYISVLCEIKDKPINKTQEENVLGIDMSLNCLAVYSDGTKAKYPKFYINAVKRLGQLQKRYAKMQDGSKNKEKLRIRIAKLHERIHNQRMDFLYHEAIKLISKYNAIVVEDIDLRAMANRKCHHGKSIGDIGFGMFRIILENKLKEIGGVLIKADRFYPSSQSCSKCGYKNPIVKDLSVREWTCPVCGEHHDRDINAAINLKNYYHTVATTGIEACGDFVRPEMAEIDEARKVDGSTPEGVKHQSVCFS